MYRRLELEDKNNEYIKSINDFTTSYNNKISNNILKNTMSLLFVSHFKLFLIEFWKQVL